MSKRIWYVLIGIMSGLTWAIDSVLLGKTIITSAVLLTVLHDFGAIRWSGFKNFRTNKMVSLSAVFGAIGSFGYIGAVVAGGPAVGVIMSASYPLVSYIVSYNKKTLIGLSLFVLDILVVVGMMGGLGHDVTSKAVLLGVLCISGWCMESFLLTRNHDNISSDTLVANRMMTSVILGSVILTITNSWKSALVGVGIKEIVFIIALGILGGLSYKLWYTAVIELGSALGDCMNLTYLPFTMILVGQANPTLLVLAIIHVILIYKVDTMTSTEESARVARGEV